MNFLLKNIISKILNVPNFLIFKPASCFVFPDKVQLKNTEGTFAITSGPNDAPPERFVAYTSQIMFNPSKLNQH
jgi:hypothetical protein